MLVALPLLLALAAPASPTAKPTAADPATLARALASRNGDQAVVLLNDGRTAAAELEAADAEALAASFKKSGVRYVPGPVAVAYAETLPDAVMYRVARLTKSAPVRRSKSAPLPADALAGGKVTFSNEPGTTIDLASLPTLKWSLPLVVSPAFTETLAPGDDLAVSVKGLDELDFLRAVAKALGGRFRQNGKELRIEPIGSELKTRALASIARAAKSPITAAEAEPGAQVAEEGAADGEAPAAPPRRRYGGMGSPGAGGTTPAAIAARLDFARVLTGVFAPTDFERFLDRTVPAITVDLAGNTAVQASLLRLLQSEAGDPAGVERVNRTLAGVNLQRPGAVRVTLGYATDVSLNVIDRRGRAVRTINLQPL